MLESRLLWSGSSDRTIRVWEINTGRCIGVLNAASGCHTEAVSCLELIPAAASPAAGEIASFSFKISACFDISLNFHFILHLQHYHSYIFIYFYSALTL